MIPPTIQHIAAVAVFARLIRAVALLLFAGQAIVAQAHMHAPAPWTGVVAAYASATSTPSPQRPEDPLSCPVCREVAHAGAYLTPGPVSLLPPASDTLWSPTAALPVFYTGRSSHSWQSRAPPPLHV